MKFILLIVTIFTATNLFSQGVILFEKTKMDLGEVQADDVPTTLTYTFQNTGNAPLLISRVVPHHSTVTAEWEKSPVLPGKKSDIKIMFSPADMSERFSVSISVNSNAPNRNNRITFNGTVTDNPRKPYLLYKIDMDSVKFKQRNISFGTIYAGQSKKDTLDFYNTRTRTLKITTRYIPHALSVEFIPTEIAPGKKGEMIVTYDSKAKNDYGYTYDNIVLSFNNDDQYKNTISVNASIKEDFSQLSAEELQDAPVANFEKSEINFGDLKEGEKVNCDFILKNTGKSNLIIRKTKASCGCTAVALGVASLQPGESTTIRAMFDSQGKKGYQNKSVTVITNDPKNPEIVLMIAGNVVE